MPALTFPLVYNVVILVVLLSFLVLLCVNLFVLPKIAAYSPSADAAPVAILVPARNEAANIEACLRSLLAQSYNNYSVWLYDDASSDGTKEIALRLAAESDGKLHVVEGSMEPPPGWLGKANACHRLYLAMREQSAPEYVLFTDADVRFEPDALDHAVACAKEWGAGLLSIFPMQVTLTLAERLAVPILLHWAVYSFLPLPFANSMRTGPVFAAANGQFLLFKREAYEAFGGHTAVRADILEDVALARATKQAGYLPLLADGGLLVRTRMYSNASEVWNGYSKNAYAFFGYSPLFLALGLLVLTALYIAPVFIFLYSVLGPHPSALIALLALSQYAVAVGARLLLSARFGYRLGDAFLHPVSIAYMMAIEVNSMLWKVRGTSAWKGRRVVSDEG